MVLSRILATAFAAFIVLGTPKSAFGVAWPSISNNLNRQIAELGVALIAHATGYFVASMANGEVTRRLGVGKGLVASSALGTVAIAAYGAVGQWWMLLLAAVILGISGGLIDALLNAYVALQHSTRVMGLLHAAYGVGGTLGPLLMTVLLSLSISWRWGYAVLAGIQLLVTVSFWQTRNRWTIDRQDSPPKRPTGKGKLRPGMLASLTVFLLYTGIEVGTGQWAFSFLTEHRSFTDAAAGLAVTAYWGSLTIGRFGLGIIGDRWNHSAMLRSSMGLATAGLIVFWWAPSSAVAALGIVTTGLGLSPAFPLLMLDTPRRIGSEYAPWAIGYQLAAATIGVIAIPGGIGLLVAWFGLQVIPPVLVASSVAMGAVAISGRLLSVTD